MANPSTVFANGVQTSTITITNIVDENGNPVPEGTVCALTATTYFLSSAGGTIEGGTANPTASYWRDFVVTNNSIVVTYRSPDLGLSPGQTANARVQVASLNPDGRIRSLVGSVDVTLVGKNSITVMANPTSVFADGIQTSTITITNIVDTDGNPVPDGTLCALTAQTFFVGSAGGTILDGAPNVSGAGFRNFPSNEQLDRGNISLAQSRPRSRAGRHC